MKHTRTLIVFAALAGLATAAHAQSELQPRSSGTTQSMPAQALPVPALPSPVAEQPKSQLQVLIEDSIAKYVDRKPEREAVAAFYQARNYKPIWTSDADARARAAAAIAYLQNVAGEGLDPREYPTPAIKDSMDEAQAAAGELQLTGLVLRYARHASNGRVSYTRVSNSILYPEHAIDPAKVLEQVSSTRKVGDVLASYEPQQPEFKKLKVALARERSGDATLDPAQNDRSGRGRFRHESDRARAEAVNTIIANMERWRWLPRDLGRDHVVVNIPDFTLAVFKDGRPVWSTKIVDGKPGRTATPLLSETMKYLTINPTWNVPPSIIRNEYLPALENDPDALERIGLKVGYNSDGSLRVYQPPGARNALGRIRFNFPNQFLVYQHDTPDKQLFARDNRALSHGCMRVQNPEKYAEVLLSLSQPEDNYSIDRIRSMYGSEERTINLKNPIPVQITYQTAFVDDKGHLEFRHDIYGLDAAVLKLMRGNERSIADIPVARHRDSSSKPVMARIPANRDYQQPYQQNDFFWNDRGWQNRSYEERSYGEHQYYRRSEGPFGRAFSLW